MFGDDAFEFVPACLGEELFGIAHDARGEANDILFGRYKRLKESFTASKRQAFELDAGGHVERVVLARSRSVSSRLTAVDVQGLAGDEGRPFEIEIPSTTSLISPTRPSG